MTSCITDLHLTFGGIMAPNKFHKVVTTGHLAADMNKGEGTAAYLWFKRGDGAPLSSIRVLYDDEATPEGFTKISKDISRGQRVYIAYSSDPETVGQPGITELRVMFTEGPPEEEGVWEQVDRSVNRTDGGVFLWFRRRGEHDSDADESGKWSAQKLNVGDWFDCKDALSRWCMAQVIAKLPDNQISVRYKLRGRRWDETVSLSETKRMAELGSHGTQSASSLASMGAAWDLELSELESYKTKLRQYLDGELEEEVAEHFSKALLPEFVERNMRFKHTGSATVDDVNSFFQCVLELIVVHIRNHSEPLPQHIKSMFDQLSLGDPGAVYFFNATGTVVQDTPEADAASGPFAEIPNGRASPHFVKNMNVFGELGGYDAILDRIKCKDPPVQLAEVELFTKLMSLAKFCYTEDWGVPYFTDLRNAIQERLETLSDEELKDLDQELVDNTYNLLLQLLNAVVGDDYDEAMEKLQLSLGARFLRCPYIVKRVKGITMILIMIDNVNANELPQPHGEVDLDIGPVWMSSNYLARWLIDNQIIETVLGEEVNEARFDVHVELVRRLPDMLSFLARKRCVQGPWLHRLWAITADSGDAVQRVVYEMLGRLSQRLPLTLLDPFWDTVAATPAERINEKFLEFVQEFTAKGIVVALRASEHRQFGLALLWELAQEHTELGKQVSPELRDLSVISLTLLLRTVQCRRFALQFLEAALENVKEGKSVCASLQLVREWVAAQPVYSASHEGAARETRQDVLDYLHKKHDVLTVLVNDINRYMNLASAAAAEIRSESVATSQIDLSGAKLVGNLAHFVQLNRRLDFLRFFLNDSAAVLTFELVKALWDSFCSGAVDASDRQQFLDWLNKAMFGDGQDHSSVSCVALEDHVMVDVFTELLCDNTSMNFSSLQPIGYYCFEAFFRHVNGRMRKLLRPNSQRCQVVAEDLIGLATLWDIALTSPPEPASLAIHYLVLLHVRVGGALSKQRHWSGFIATCMDLIDQAASRLDVEQESNEHTIDVVLQLLSLFLDKVEHSGPRPLSSKVIPAPVVLYISREQGDATTYTFKGASTMPLGDLRSTVASTVNADVATVRITTSDGDVLYPSEYDTLSVHQLRIPRLLHITLLDEAEPDLGTPMSLQDLEEERNYPRELLSNNQRYFELLFQLLSLHNKAIVLSAWGLIQNLPTNENIRTSIKTFGGVLPPSPRRRPRRSYSTEVDDSLAPLQSPDSSSSEADSPPPAQVAPGSVNWHSLLDGRAVLKLLYSLEIVDHLVSTDTEASHGESEVRRLWCDKFVELGGFSHLHHILMEADVSTMLEDELSTSCLSILLRLINYFTIVPKEFQSLQTTKDLPELDYQQLINRLMQVLVATSGPLLTLPFAKASRDGRIPETSHSSIVGSCCSLIIAILKQHPRLLEDVYANVELPNAIMCALLRCNHVSVREAMKRGLMELCSTVQPGADGGMAPKAFFLPVLLEELQQVYKNTSRCSEYFFVVCRMLRCPPPPPPPRKGKAGKAPAPPASGSGSGAGVAPPPVPPAGPPPALHDDKVMSDTDLSGTLVRLSGLLVDHAVVEATPSDFDPVLHGLLRMVIAVVRRRNELKALPVVTSIVTEVFLNCLFASPKPDSRGKPAPPKCKHRVTRKVAMALLTELCMGCTDNAQVLVKLLLPHHNTVPPTPKATRKSILDIVLSDGADDGKSSTGYVGLKNLGMICYMNSSMQQFFNVPGFRKDVLAYVDEEDDKAGSIMYQMQRMFAYLQESERRFYNPEGFAMAVKDMGEATNVMVQKDASEFLTNMFQQVEESVSGTKHEKLLRKFFGGTHTTELLAEGGHYSARDEPFYFLSVSVKNMKTLEESLTHYIAGENVDYRWEEPDGTKKQLDTTKRTSIKDLPPHLFIHLKRFEFDFDLMEQVKVNSRFAFPEKLNLKPFSCEGRADAVKPEVSRQASTSSTEEGEESKGPADATTAAPAEPRDDSYYEYELMGVVVHTGTMEMGHYYSYIRERDPSSSSAACDVRRWMEFNDDIVTPWDPADIEEDCYGGSATNAFLLVYDRVVKTGSDGATGAGSGAGAEAEAGSQLTYSQIAERRRQASQARRGLIAPELFNEVWQDNLDYLHKQQIFNTDYFDFLLQLVQSIRTSAANILTLPEEADACATTLDLEAQAGPSVAALRLGLLFMFNTLPQAADLKCLPTWSTMLQTLLTGNHVASAWLLETLMANPASFQKAMLGATQADVRFAMAALTARALRVLAPGQRELLQAGDDSPHNDKEPRAAGSKAAKVQVWACADPELELACQVPPSRVSVAFIDMVLDSLKDLHLHWRAYSSYWQLLLSYAELGPTECAYLVRKGCVSRMIHCLLGPHSPLAPPREDDDVLPPPPRPSLVTFLALVNKLVTPPMELSDADHSMLTCDGFLSQLLAQLWSSKRVDAVKALVTQLCWEDPDTSTSFVSMLAAQVAPGTMMLKSVFRAVSILCGVKDSMQAKRTEVVIMALLDAMKAASNIYMCTEQAIEHLTKLCKRNPVVHQFLAQDPQKALWCAQWLQDNPTPPTDPRAEMRLFPLGMAMRVQFSAASFIRSRQLLPNMLRVLGGREIEQDGYDSDDEPEALVGMRVSVRWSQGKFFRGVVDDYRDDTGEHHVTYDDGDSKWYDMSLKTFHVLGQALEDDDGSELSDTDSDYVTDSGESDGAEAAS